MSILTQSIDLGNPVSDHPLNRGLVSWWLPLPNNSGGSKLFDLKNRNHGTLTGGPTWLAGRNNTAAINFDGSDDYISIPAFSSISGDFFVSVAVKDDPTSGNRTFFGGQGSDPLLEIWVGDFGGTSTYNWRAYCGTFPGGFMESTLSKNNDWTYVTLSRQSGSATLYVNGRAGATISNSETFSPFNSRIGCRENGSLFFDGKIQSVRVSTTRGLSASGAQQEYVQWLRNFPGLLNHIPLRVWSFGTVSSGGGGSPVGPLIGGKLVGRGILVGGRLVA